MIPQAGALIQMAADDGGNVAGLILLVFGRVAVDLIALAVVCPEGLSLRPWLFLITQLAAFRMLEVER